MESTLDRQVEDEDAQDAQKIDQDDDPEGWDDAFYRFHTEYGGCCQHCPEYQKALTDAVDNGLTY